MTPIIQGMPLLHEPLAHVFAIDGAPSDAPSVLILLDLDAGHRSSAYPNLERLAGDLTAAIGQTAPLAGLIPLRRIYAPESDPLAVERQGVAIDNHRRRNPGFGNRAGTATA